ncbi:helix-turn-helix transcriptional regulator [Planosporangium thailandense]|uniref:Helix-turn-helix transcriptional regulator n=1 Tax=Planosporangium thailandense TaxID=765197 RepID=A0ABX0XUS7_9ACTN|nr:helix-turn-helix domain-containing protein [Planosporangium thailandense]NJC69039.1 helix-turn-helix transcriptional regulator [Planosporangium thailandense]
MRVRTPTELGALVRDRRRDQGLSQEALATRARVSRRWLAALEAGKPSAEVGLVLSTLEALNQEVSVDDRAGTTPTVDLDAVLAAVDEEDR